MYRNKQQSKKKHFWFVAEELIKKVKRAEQTDPTEICMSWQEIEKRLNKSTVSLWRRVGYVASVAAILAMLFFIDNYFQLGDKKVASSMSLAMLADTVPITTSEIVLIAQHGKIELKDKSSLAYKVDGELFVNKSAINKETSDPIKKEDENFNQIIVPKGRRANIIFSDGTKMFVNAGSHVIYPAVFDKDKREILVEGEVFLEVSKDTSRPFIVKTSSFDVKVLGTQFNVSAYKDDQSSSVVLVNGSVEVETSAHNKALLKPNQRIEITGAKTITENVDVFEHICWKDNMMMLTDRRVGDVLDRLARYYGCKIEYEDAIAEMPVSGKLDLKENVEEVIDLICLSLNINYTQTIDNDIIVTLK